MKPTTFLLGALLIFSACKRDKKTPVTTQVHGYLMVLGTDDVIKDRPYKIILTKPQGKEVYDETYTDENGYFELSHKSFIHKSDSWAEHEYIVHADDVVPDETFRDDGFSMDFEESSFFSGFKGQINLTVAKKAWVELQIINKNPQPGDYIRIDYHNKLLGIFYQHELKFVLEGLGNWRNRLDYWIFKQGEHSNAETDWIWLGEMDTAYFKLEY